MALNPRRGLNHPRRTRKPPHPPSGHRVGLGHAADDHRTRCQLGYDGRHRVKAGFAVDEPLIDLVGDHPDTGIGCPTADGLHSISRIDHSGGIRGRREEQGPGSLGCGRFELAGRYLESGVIVGFDEHRNPAGELNRSRVGHPIRGRDQHLVTGIEEQLEGGKDGLFRTVRHHDLARVEVKAVLAMGGCDGLPELGKARRRRVMVHRRVPCGRDRGIDDVAGRREVGLAGSVTDDRLACGPESPRLGADCERRRRFDAGNALRDWRMLGWGRRHSSTMPGIDPRRRGITTLPLIRP